MLVPHGASAVGQGLETEGNTLQISIDSTEPLGDVMRVIGALYNVTLTVTTAPNEAAKPASATTRQGRGRNNAARSKNTRVGGGRPATRRANVSTGEVRSWARENSHPVSDRGPISAAVLAAYHEARSN